LRNLRVKIDQLHIESCSASQTFAVPNHRVSIDAKRDENREVNQTGRVAIDVDISRKLLVMGSKIARFESDTIPSLQCPPAMKEDKHGDEKSPESYYELLVESRL